MFIFWGVHFLLRTHRKGRLLPSLTDLYSACYLDFNSVIRKKQVCTHFLNGFDEASKDMQLTLEQLSGRKSLNIILTPQTLTNSLLSTRKHKLLINTDLVRYMYYILYPYNNGS